MELLHLKYFQVVAIHEHMTRAAEELHITQPALSIMISRLEAELGVPLFKRENRGIKLNEFGKAYLKHVNRIFTEMSNAEKELQEIAEYKDHHIVLATTSSRFASGLCTHFLKSYPKTNFHLFKETAIQKIKQFITAGDIDFCISAPPIDGSEFQCIPLLDDELFIGVPRNHRYANRTSIKLIEVAEDPFINETIGYSFREITESFCKLAGFTPNVVFEGDRQLMQEFIQTGCGIGWIPKSAIKNYNLNTLTILRIEEPRCYRQISISWYKDKYLSEFAQLFLQFVINFYRNSWLTDCE
jgi:DNA-binding transcriptional LysR family regulator